MYLRYSGTMAQHSAPAKLMPLLPSPELKLSRAAALSTETTKGSSQMQTAATTANTPQRVAITLTWAGQVITRYGQ
jgi:hypothetical protein